MTTQNNQAIQSRKWQIQNQRLKLIEELKRQTLVNKSRKSRYRTAIKKINLLIEKKDKKAALNFLPKLNSELMKIAKTGVVKRQNASRNVSRITKRINSL